MRRLALLGLLALAFAALWAWAAQRDPEGEAVWTATDTSFSSGPRGLRGLYLLLDRLGLSVTRLRRPAYARLPEQDVLWLLSDHAPGPLERDWIAQFVRRGGTLVASPLALGGLLQSLDVGDAELEQREGPVTAGGLSLTLERHWAIEKLPEPERVWAAEPKGAPVVASWRAGQGRVVVCGLWDAARNAQIAKGDNGLFFAHLAFDLGGHHVFDERLAGYGESSLWALITGAPWALGLGQLALALSLLLWSLLPRRLPAEQATGARVSADGRPLGREPPRRRAVRDHVDAVAALWAKAGDPGLPLERLLAGVEGRARARLQAAGEGAFEAWVTALRPELAARARAAALHARSVSQEGRRANGAEARRAAQEILRIEREVASW
ncbi:MAG: DUF4350 domain-containing protein [Deltaproteobacteria bacterium]